MAENLERDIDVEGRLHEIEGYIKLRQERDVKDQKLFGDLHEAQDDQFRSLVVVQNKCESLERQSRSHNLRFGNVPLNLTERLANPEQRKKQEEESLAFFKDILTRGYKFSNADANGILSRFDFFHPVARGTLILALNRGDRKKLLHGKSALRDYKYQDRKIFVSDDLTQAQQAVEKESRDMVRRAKDVFPDAVVYSMRNGFVHFKGTRIRTSELVSKIEEESRNRLKRTATQSSAPVHDPKRPKP